MAHADKDREILSLLTEKTTQRRGFEMMVAQYSQPIYWQIRRMVLSHDDANDLLQNTFIKAWTHLDYFRAEAKVSTWLYRIATNECLNLLERQRAEQALSVDDPAAAAANRLEADPYFDGNEAQRRLCNDFQFFHLSGGIKAQTGNLQRADAEGSQEQSRHQIGGNGRELHQLCQTGKHQTADQCDGKRNQRNLHNENLFPMKSHYFQRAHHSTIAS